MITSPQNEKLKLVRRLGRKRARDADGLFVTEGEDLLEAGRATGAEPLELLCAAGEGLGGTEVEPELLDGVAALGSGTRVIGVWRQRWAEELEPPCIYLHGVSDPGNVGTIVRTASSLVGGTVVLGPGCADPFGPRAVRASMGAVFGQGLAKGEVAATPAPRAALVAHDGEPLESLGTPATICLGSEREGLPQAVIAECETRVTIPLRAGAESLNVAAAAAIALQRISSPAQAKMGDSGDG
ncbi:MAG: RNA methyltransferase [Actinobacteria bacterium]|nr:RNA methyltransferase [Actinomycetota bacterium]